MGEDERERERENTKDPGADSSPSLPGVESLPDPGTATALSLRRRDIEAKHGRNVPPEVGEDGVFACRLRPSIEDMNTFNVRAVSTFP